MSMIRHGLMMGVRSDGVIFKWDGTSWCVVAGNLRSIAAAQDGAVWGVNSNNEAFRWGTTDWVRVSGNIMKVAVRNATEVYALDTELSNNVRKWNGANDWAYLPGRDFDDISVSSDGAIWGTRFGRVFKYDGSAFQLVAGSLKRISAGRANMVWGVNDAGKVFRLDGSDWKEVKVPEPFSEVTVSSDGAVCGIAASNAIYHYKFTSHNN